MKCPQCNFDNPDTQRFCGECAAPLIPAKEIGITKTKLMDSPVEELSTGSTFTERYQIIEELGKGGMGRVYKVLDKETNERIALKLIKPEIASDKKTIERFRNELTTARKIVQKNVCRMYDLNKEKDSYYITMEFVSGGDLKKLIRRTKRLDIGTAISIAKQVCKGLSEAHSLGIVHRDLKPNNIMIDDNGNARIMDFGIARTIKGKGITGAGVMIGTPEYMSPEQAEAKEVDYRSDIYSLGVILFEMVTGQLPFEGDTPLSIAMKHKSEAPPNPKWKNAQIPESLSRVILTCMEKDRERRYQSSEELLSELSKIEEAKPEVIKISEWKNSIAVLPFKNMSADPEQEYFADGMTEALIANLAKLRTLRIISRTSAMRYKGSNNSLPEIAEELNVDMVLEGSVLRVGQRVRITTQLIHAASDTHLWAESYERDVQDVLLLQSEVAQAVAREIQVEVTPEEKKSFASARRVNPEAYEAYLKGRFHEYRAYPEDFDRALDYFNLALEKDPDYAPAYTGIADVWGARGCFGFVPPGEASRKVKAAALKAVELDDLLAEGHEILGRFRFGYEWDWAAAEREFQRAIALSDNNPYVRFGFWWFLSSMKRSAEAQVQIERALELDPFNFFFQTLLGWHLLYEHRYDDAIAQFHKALATEPNFVWPRWGLWSSFHQKRMAEEALAEAKRYFSLLGNSEAAAAMERCYAASGYRGAMSLGAEKLVAQAKLRYVQPTQIARLYAHAEEKDLALHWLEKAYEVREPWLVLLNVDLDWDILRDDPRFTKLLKRIGLENDR